mmetsp:Transcript_48304/g.87125  ORF Transcript_48304/g.87125 Transcript_48304/m.87125 type:complete len:339 (-) Transcript_48304:44-1060(-)
MAIEDQVQNTVNASEYIPNEKLAKALIAGVDDGISNTDLKKSSNNDDDESTDESCASEEGAATPAQVGPGLFPSVIPGSQEATARIESESEEEDDEIPSETGVPGFMPVAAAQGQEDMQQQPEQGQAEENIFGMEETVFIFDWDDTVLPSTWVQCQGLRLDDSSEVSPWQREQLAEVAKVAAETLRIAKQLGTVVLITNAERGWIELSCQKFMPTLFPALESVKAISARTTYENAENVSPLDWKVAAFANEISNLYGGQCNLNNSDRRKNVLSLGDSVHEREALLRATAPLPNCRSKSLKFVERPDIAQICKQHSLVTSCFERIAHHDGNLDLCIRCT